MCLRVWVGVCFVCVCVGGWVGGWVGVGVGVGVYLFCDKCASKRRPAGADPSDILRDMRERGRDLRPFSTQHWWIRMQSMGGFFCVSACMGGWVGVCCVCVCVCVRTVSYTHLRAHET